MDVSRRSFLRGALAIAAVAIAQPTLALASLPTIYGDGVRDDSDGLQALFDGRPFRVDGVVVKAESGAIEGGLFAIRKAVVVRADNISIKDCTFLAMRGFTDPYLMLFEGASSCCIYRSHFDGRNIQDADAVLLRFNSAHQ
ncbi:hypothetical protein [Mesorhizobium sp. ORM16]|uniref:hypothetical protein n=1 Tax=Mesorhizobium sp. ORM16 TaxID=3376989 RepID=UPI0038573F6F